MIIDLETNGLPKRIDSRWNPCYNELELYDDCRIVQISIITCNNFNEQYDLYDQIIKRDGFDITNSKFHSITNEISDTNGIPFKQIVDTLYDKLCKTNVILSHNTDFDIPVLKSELYRYGYDYVIDEINKKKIICTMNSTMKFVNATYKDSNQVKYPSLNELYRFIFGIENDNPHNSKYDVINLYESIKYMVNEGVIRI